MSFNYFKIANNKTRILKENLFIKNSVTLTFGTAISQFIPAAFSPVLTRLFSPEEFGLFAVISSITAILSVISTGKYETAIILTKDDRSAANVVFLSLFLSMVVSILSFILFCFTNVLDYVLKQTTIKYLILLSPIISFLTSVYLCYNEWCIRKAWFKQLAANKIFNSSSISISNVLFGLLKLPAGGLIFGELTGRFFTSLLCFYNWLRKDLFYFKGIFLSGILNAAKKYINCPKYILPGQLLNTASMQLIVLLIATFFGEKEVGFYSITSIVIYVPVSVISTAIRDVFKQRTMEEFKRKNDCMDIFKKTTLTITLISIIIFGVLFIVLPDLFDFLFGSKWRIAGIYARILCPMVFISFISESVFGVLYSAEKMKMIFIWQVIYLTINVSSLLLGYYIFGNIKLTLLCFAAGKSIVHIISLFMSYYAAKGNLKL